MSQDGEMNIPRVRFIIPIFCGSLLFGAVVSTKAEKPNDTKASVRRSPRPTVSPSPMAGPTVSKAIAGFVPGQVIVVFRKTVSEERIKEINRSQSTTILKVIPNPKIYLLKLSGGVSPLEAARTYREIPDVLASDPNFLVHAANDPNDPFFPQQWYFKNTTDSSQGNHPLNLGFVDADIDAPEGWALSKGAPNIKIAILDSGIDDGHIDLAGKIVGKINFSTTPPASDVLGHGTHVAGLAAANTNNGSGIAGTCPDCSLLNAKVLDDTGNGELFDLLQGIYWAVNNGANILNASLAGQGGCPDTLQSLIITVVSPPINVIFVAAAGNDAWNLNAMPAWPAVCSDVVTVAATDARDDRASFSNYGAPIVDIAAPGLDVLSLLPGGGTTRKSGTSMAAPIVSGALGVIWAHFPGFTNTQVVNQMLTNADKIDGTASFPGYPPNINSWQNGRLNLCRALGLENCDPPHPKPLIITAPECPPNGQIVTLDLSTGTTNGTDDSFGAQDSKWHIIQTPSSTHNQLPGLYPIGSYPAFNTASHSAWVLDNTTYQQPGANWIHPLNSPVAQVPNWWLSSSRGFYKYGLLFNLPPNNYTSLTLAGDHAEDNSAKFFLNGHQIVPGGANVAGAFNVLTPFGYASNGLGFFTLGTNALVVEVENLSSVVGLRVRAELRAKCNDSSCDLEIRKVMSPNPLVSGQPATVTITVKNVGNLPCSPQSISGTIMSDDVNPASLTFTGPPTVNQSGWQCSLGVTASCVAPGLTLPPSYSATFTINAIVTAPAGGSVTNCATVSNGNDIKSVNNKACVTVNVKKRKIGPPADPSSPD